MKKLLLLGILSTTDIETLDAAEKKQKYFQSQLNSNQNHQIGILSSSAPSTFGFNPSAPAFTATTPPPPPNSPDSEDEIFLSSPQEIENFKLWKQQQKQGDMHYRSAGSLNITGQIKAHRRQRSLSNPEDLVATAPNYSHLDAIVSDANIALANTALDAMEKNAQTLFNHAKQVLKAAADRHKELTQQEINSDLPERKGIEKVKKLWESDRKRLEKHLSKQTSEHAKTTEKSSQALNILIATIIDAKNTLDKLSEKVDHKAEKSKQKHDELFERKNSVSHSPAASRRSDSGYGSNSNSNA